MAEVVEIGKYSLHLYVRPAQIPYIILYDKQGTMVGNLYFRREDPAPDSSKSALGVYRFYYRREDYEDVVDVLRNEEPVFLLWYGNTGNLSTSAEPIGEGEGDPTVMP